MVCVCVRRLLEKKSFIKVCSHGVFVSEGYWKRRVLSKFVPSVCLWPTTIGKEEFYQSLFPVCVCVRVLSKFVQSVCLCPKAIGKEEFYQSLFPWCVCVRRLLEKKSFIKVCSQCVFVADDYWKRRVPFSNDYALFKINTHAKSTFAHTMLGLRIKVGSQCVFVSEGYWKRRVLSKSVQSVCLCPKAIGKEEFYQSLFLWCVCVRSLLEKKSFIKVCSHCVCVRRLLEKKSFIKVCSHGVFVSDGYWKRRVLSKFIPSVCLCPKTIGKEEFK